MKQDTSHWPAGDCAQMSAGRRGARSLHEVMSRGENVERNGQRNLLNWTRSILVVIGLSIAVAACGDSDPLEVTEAQSASGSHSVIGLLVAHDDVVRLCEVLLESFPPQCGGASIEIRGLDLSTVNGLQTEQEVSWTDQEITVTGVLESGVLDIE